jgi:DNA-binding NtrC family response regulator
MKDTRPRDPRPQVVCVDDEAPVLSALSRALRRESYRVLITQEPADVLARVRDGGVRAVVADHRMPQMNGADLLREVRRIAPETTLILLTGYASECVRSETLNLDRVHLVAKPWDNDALRHLLRESVRRTS